MKREGSETGVAEKTEGAEQVEHRPAQSAAAPS